MVHVYLRLVRDRQKYLYHWRIDYKTLLGHNLRLKLVFSSILNEFVSFLDHEKRIKDVPAETALDPTNNWLHLPSSRSLKDILQHQAADCDFDKKFKKTVLEFKLVWEFLNFPEKLSRNQLDMVSYQIFLKIHCSLVPFWHVVNLHLPHYLSAWLVKGPEVNPRWKCFHWTKVNIPVFGLWAQKLSIVVPTYAKSFPKLRGSRLGL